jgi:hypothetical protein
MVKSKWWGPDLDVTKESVSIITNQEMYETDIMVKSKWWEPDVIKESVSIITNKGVRGGHYGQV